MVAGWFHLKLYQMFKDYSLAKVPVWKNVFFKLFSQFGSAVWAAIAHAFEYMYMSENN